MALGLNGHLNNLAELNTYEYLIKCHEMTSVGLLLGVAAARRGEPRPDCPEQLGCNASVITYLQNHVSELLSIVLYLSYCNVDSRDRLCGLVVRVPGYRSRVPGPIPGATRFSEK
jgi:hypothetical protein